MTKFDYDQLTPFEKCLLDELVKIRIALERLSVD